MLTLFIIRGCEPRRGIMTFKTIHVKHQRSPDTTLCRKTNKNDKRTKQ